MATEGGFHSERTGPTTFTIRFQFSEKEPEYAEVISTTFHSLEHKTFSMIPVRSEVRETVARWIAKKESQVRIWSNMKIVIQGKPYKPKK